MLLESNEPSTSLGSDRDSSEREQSLDAVVDVVETSLLKASSTLFVGASSISIDWIVVADDEPSPSACLCGGER